MSIVGRVLLYHPAMHPLPTEFPDFGLTPEQRREAVFGHYYEYPGMDGERGEIWCYTPRFAYRTGDTVTLHVSSTATHFRLDDRPRRRRGNAGADDRQPGSRALAGHAGPMLGRGLRLGSVARIPRRRRLAVRRLPHHADRRRPRRQADLLPSSLHRHAGARPQARPHPAGGRDRHLDWPTTPGAAPTTTRASPGPKRDQYRADRQHRAAAGAAASSCCRRMRRACRWRSPCRR